MITKSMPSRKRGWIPVLGKGLLPRMRGSRSTNDVERDDDARIRHPALSVRRLLLGNGAERLRDLGNLGALRVDGRRELGRSARIGNLGGGGEPLRNHRIACDRRHVGADLL